MMKKHKRTLKEVTINNQKHPFIKIINNYKRLCLISVVALVLIIVVSLLLTNLNHSKAIDNSELLSDQQIDNLKFINANLSGNKYTVVVYNTLDTKYNLNTIDVTFQDSNKQEIITINGYIGNVIDQKDMKQLVVETDEDLSKTKYIKYNINK